MDEAGATRCCCLFRSSDSASSLLSNGSDFRFFFLSSRVLSIRPISINLLYASRAAFFSASFLVFDIPVPKNWVASIIHKNRFKFSVSLYHTPKLSSTANSTCIRDWKVHRRHEFLWNLRFNSDSIVLRDAPMQQQPAMLQHVLCISYRHLTKDIVFVWSFKFLITSTRSIISRRRFVILFPVNAGCCFSIERTTAFSNMNPHILGDQ